MEKVKIAIVEDECLVAEEIKAILEDKGYAVPYIASSGRECLEQMRRERPDMVLMDIKLKEETSGIDTAEKINELFHIPVIYLTAYADKKTLQLAKKTHPYGYILKPVSSKELEATIEISYCKYIAERDLDQAHRQLETILATTHLMIAHMDRDFNFIRVNHAYAAADGRPMDFFPGKNHFELYPNQENEIIFRSVVALGEPHTSYAKPFEYEYDPVRGKSYWDWTLSPVKDENGLVQELVLTLVDVTIMFKALHKLKKSEEGLKEAQAMAHLGNWEYLVQEDILWWSDELYRIFGLDKDEVKLTMDLFIQHVHPEERDELLEAINKKLPYRKVCRIIRADNEVRYIKEEAAQIKDPEGNITLIRGTAQDITEAKLAETKRIELERQLNHANKLETLGQLAGNMAHDFNNTLMAIMGYAQMMQLKLNDRDKLKNFIDSLLQTADNAANLTQRLMAFSRKPPSKPMLLDLNDTLLKMKKLLHKLLGEEISLNLNLSQDELIIFWDPGNLEQLILNLVNNARDAMAGKGVIEITTNLMAITPETMVYDEILSPGKYVSMEIRDTGSGMDEKTLEKIFEPYFTTKEFGKGTGLGLSIVYGLIKQNKGHIQVQSSPGLGSTFTALLPVFKSGNIENRKMEELSDLPRGSETILLAEDDPALREILYDALTDFGYDVIQAKNGQEAIRKFLENRNRVKLLLLDLMLPVLTGKEVYQEILLKFPSIQVLFMSSHSFDTIQRQGLAEISANFIIKPVSLVELLKKIREILDSALYFF
jgi:PAS domain S-box-containing protein